MTAIDEIGPLFDFAAREAASLSGAAVAQLAPGPRAAEALLLDALSQANEESKRDPALLASPVRVVVPSRSLREHLSAALLSRTGAAVAGIEIQTAHRLACDVSSRAGTGLPGAEELLPLAVARLAREEPALRRSLDDLAGGYRVVESVVHDLLDAGFEPIHAEFVGDQLDELAYGGAFGQRVRAALNVAAAVADRVEKGDLGHRSVLFRSALTAIDRDPRLLRCRAVWIYGFADATGALSDFLEGLVRHSDARVVLDRPRDPCNPAREDAGVAFTLRFAERLTGLVETSALYTGAPPSRLRILRAPGPAAELQAVASRIRALIDAGATPERIGVVARDLTAFRLPLRRHFGQLAIPYSGHAEVGAFTPAGRRLQALLGLLRRGGAAPAEAFLDAVECTATHAGATGRALDHTERADIAWALHGSGVARLDHLAARAASGSNEQDLSLDVRSGLTLHPERGATAEHRSVPQQLLQGVSQAAAGFLEGWFRQDVRAALAFHAAALLDLVESTLGWSTRSHRDGEPASGAGLLLARGVEIASADSVDVDRAEFVSLLERRLDGAGRDALGGCGGGVQVLGVMEARSRTFDHLFVIGLERGSFPRTIQEDPIVPDALRRKLRSVLPDLPVKADGHDEERFLFAQLVDASPDVVLSASVSDDDAKPRPVSPFIERLEASGRVEETLTLPPRWSRATLDGRDREAADVPVLRAPHELLQLTGLYGSRPQFHEALEAVLGAAPGAAELAAGRMAVLSELDPHFSLRDQLGPYFGFVGRASEAADPRRADLYVTSIESLCACPWRTFLTKLLRLAPAPDALAALPDLDARLLGAAVHASLDAIVAAQLAEPVETRLEAVLARTPRVVSWPEADELRALAVRESERVLAKAGRLWPALTAALAARLLAFLDAARQAAWPGTGSDIGVLGVEVTGKVELPALEPAGEPRAVYFRADRVDGSVAGSGDIALYDYKTGRPVAVQQNPERRRAALIAQVARGDMLQAVAYALGARALSEHRVEGRYLYISPDAPDHARVAAAPADDEAFEAAFTHAASSALDALSTGSFFPRLVDASGVKEPPLCERCEVRDACARGDSGARRRLLSWRAARQVDSDLDGEVSLGDAAALAVWQLHEVPT